MHYARNNKFCWAAVSTHLKGEHDFANVWTLYFGRSRFSYAIAQSRAFSHMILSSWHLRFHSQVYQVVNCELFSSISSTGLHCFSPFRLFLSTSTIVSKEYVKSIEVVVYVRGALIFEIAATGFFVSAGKVKLLWLRGYTVIPCDREVRKGITNLAFERWVAIYWL